MEILVATCRIEVVKIPISELAAQDVEFFGSMSQDTRVDGEHVTLFNPDEFAVEELENRGIPYQSVVLEGTAVAVKTEAP